MKKLLVCIILLLFVTSGCSKDSLEKENSVVLTISAAASLQNVLEEMRDEFQKKHSDIDIKYNFGASGSLAKQIEQGAPVDLFLSASSEKFDELKTKGFIQEDAVFISNELVLITGITGDLQINNMEDLATTDVEKISIGTPEIVPAGSYAKQALENFNLWTNIESKLVYAKDVRQVLTYVETGNVEAGFVYKTDAISSEKIKVIQTVAETSHDLITYPIGILENTESLSEAKEFYKFLQSEDVKEIWVKYGFTLIH